jgi:hypothetical protein
MSTFCHRSTQQHNSSHAIYGICIPDRHHRAVARLLLIIHGIEMVIRCGAVSLDGFIYVRKSDASTALKIIYQED